MDFRRFQALEKILVAVFKISNCFSSIDFFIAITNIFEYITRHVVSLRKDPWESTVCERCFERPQKYNFATALQNALFSLCERLKASTSWLSESGFSCYYWTVQVVTNSKIWSYMRLNLLASFSSKRHHKTILKRSLENLKKYIDSV